MTSKYEFDAERWLRNWSARKRFLLADGRDPFAMCADELHRLRMAVDLHEQGAELMREESNALLARHNALREAVAWERSFPLELVARNGTMKMHMEYQAARAEVDRLLEEKL